MINRLISRTISLEENERKLCDLLVDVTSYLKSTRPDIPPVTCRVAGGWVRDKLLGINCHDMDIALDTMMGYDFAQYVREYLKTSSKGVLSSVAKIKSNPEKSKHLETATARLFGLDVDFVNLRSETYMADNRIPDVQFGTPLEDAQRRDLTINSLFYNLHTRSVEDFLGTGLSDLENGIVRTPLPPFETFRDDPLRILRCIRFASRFGYRISLEIPLAIKHTEIKRLLATVISKERVGVEVAKMMTKRQCLESVRYFVDFNLFPIVFQPPSEYQGEIWPFEESLGVIERFIGVVESEFGKEIISLMEPLGKSEWMIMNLACTLWPYSNMKNKIAKKKMEKFASFHICRESLKLPSYECEAVEAIHANHQKLLMLIDQCEKMHNATDLKRRKEIRRDIGGFLRSLGSKTLKSKLWMIFLYSAGVTGNVESHRRLFEFIKDLRLTNAHEIIPVFDGTNIVELSSEIVGRKVLPGKWIGDVLEAFITLQLLEGETKSDEWLKIECKNLLKTYLNENKV